MLSNARFHRGRATDALMDSAKVIISEVQRKRSLWIFPLLTKSIRQSAMN
jgi:hypothetical protein